MANVKLGPTNEFPEGKLNPTDEGALLLGVAWDPKSKNVIINFGTPVSWLGLPREHAVQFAKMIMLALPAEEG
jgi:hypothetical protein